MVLISHQYWQRAFAASPSAVGQTLMLNNTQQEVIGVLPEDFQFLTANPLVILPMQIDRATIHAAGFNFQGLARLKPGVTMAQATPTSCLLPSLTTLPAAAGFHQEDVRRCRFGSRSSARGEMIGSSSFMYCVLPITPHIWVPVAAFHFLVMLSPVWQPQLLTNAPRAKTRRLIFFASSSCSHDLQALSIALL